MECLSASENHLGQLTPYRLGMENNVGEEEIRNQKSCPVPFQRTTEGGLLGDQNYPGIKDYDTKVK